jgi:transketolase
MVGDGECNEGVVWESAHVAQRYALDNLIVVVDDNRLQQFGWRDPGSGRRLPPYQGSELRDWWAAFGWRVLEVDGHDVASVIDVLGQASAPQGVPVVVIARTIKGKGVSFMENEYSWHSRVPTPDELRAALDELADPVPPAPELVGRAAAAASEERG